MASATSELGPDELERLRAGLEILALRSLGDREAAEDAAQETLTRAVEASKQGRIRNPEKLGAFVRGIARNVIADVLRARQRTTGLESLAGSAARSAQADPLSLIISKEQRQQLRVASANICGDDPFHIATDVAIRGNLVYSTWLGGGVRAIDISDPTNPVQVAKFISNQSASPSLSDVALLRTDLVVATTVWWSGMYVLSRP